MGFSLLCPNGRLKLSDEHHILSQASTHEYNRLRILQDDCSTLVFEILDFSTFSEQRILQNPRVEFEFAL